MAWSIAFYRHELGDDPGQPAHLFANLPDAVGDRILAFVLPILRAARAASQGPEPLRNLVGMAALEISEALAGRSPAPRRRRSQPKRRSHA